MKNITRALTGKKALVLFTVILTICTVLDIATSIRIGTKIDFLTYGILYSVVTVWASEISKKEKANA